MMQRIKLIPASEAHLPAIHEIAVCSFPDPWSEAILLQTFQSKHSIIQCAVDQERICGYLVVSQAGSERSIDEIAVHLDARRQGIAAALLQWAHQAHHQYSSDSFWLEVRESNQASIALYQSLEYVRSGFRKRYYQNPTEGALLMAKSPVEKMHPDA